MTKEQREYHRYMSAGIPALSRMFEAENPGRPAAEHKKLMSSGIRELHRLYNSRGKERENPFGFAMGLNPSKPEIENPHGPVGLVEELIPLALIGGGIYFGAKILKSGAIPNPFTALTHSVKGAVTNTVNMGVSGATSPSSVANTSSSTPNQVTNQGDPHATIAGLNQAAAAAAGLPICSLILADGTTVAMTDAVRQIRAVGGTIDAHASLGDITYNWNSANPPGTSRSAVGVTSYCSIDTGQGGGW